MADSEDTTNPSVLPLRPGFVCLAVGDDSPALRDLDILTAPLSEWWRVPDRDAITAMMAAKGRIMDRDPRSLGDVVAKLMTVTVAGTGGDCLPPDTLSLITRSVAYLTQQTPQLRRPNLELLAHTYAGMLRDR